MDRPRSVLEESMLARKCLTDLPAPGGLCTSHCFKCLGKETTLSESEVGLPRGWIRQGKQGQAGTEKWRAVGVVAQRQRDGRGDSGITLQLVKIGQRDIALAPRRRTAARWRG